jgi:4-hydroxy-tetrahydrodipicolinate synthase
LIEFYENLLPQLPLPLFLYNMPTHTKVNFAPSTIQRIAENPGVIGFKDSSANTVYFQSVMYAMKDNPDFSMLVGPEEIMAESVLLGAHGGVNGGANMFPGLYVSLYNAAKNADIEEVRRLQEKVMQISATIYTVGQHGSSYLKGLKCALNLLGICSDYVAAPFHKFEQRERGKIWKALQNLGVDVVLR